MENILLSWGNRLGRGRRTSAGEVMQVESGEGCVGGQWPPERQRGGAEERGRRGVQETPRIGGDRWAGGLCGRVHVASRVLLLPFGATVLKPNFDLRLCEVEGQRQVESLAHTQVPSLFEFVLQRHQLLVGECRTGPPRLAAASPSSRAATAFAMSSSPTGFVLGGALTITLVARV